MHTDPAKSTDGFSAERDFPYFPPGVPQTGDQLVCEESQKMPLSED